MDLQLFGILRGLRLMQVWMEENGLSLVTSYRARDGMPQHKPCLTVVSLWLLGA